MFEPMWLRFVWHIVSCDVFSITGILCVFYTKRNRLPAIPLAFLPALSLAFCKASFSSIFAYFAPFHLGYVLTCLFAFLDNGVSFILDLTHFSMPSYGRYTWHIFWHVCWRPTVFFWRSILDVFSILFAVFLAIISRTSFLYIFLPLNLAYGWNVFINLSHLVGLEDVGRWFSPTQRMTQSECMTSRSRFSGVLFTNWFKLCWEKHNSNIILGYHWHHFLSPSRANGSNQVFFASTSRNKFIGQAPGATGARNRCPSFPVNLLFANPCHV